jgi:hypothetical protein
VPLDGFFKIVDAPKVFDFQGENLFTIFYKKWVDRSTKSQGGWEVRTRRNLLLEISTRLLGFIKFLLVALFTGIYGRVTRQSKTLLFGAEGRHSVVGGATFDLYNARIVQQRGRDRFIIVENFDDGVDKQYRADLYLSDLCGVIGRLLRFICRWALSDDLRQYARSVVERYPDLGFSGDEIAEEALGFYTRFQLYRLLLTVLNPERVLLICYYGRESFIAACKHKGIQVTELQHGSILRTHPMYNFPESYRSLFHQAPFPDKIAVYGRYWKEILVEDNIFPTDSVVIVGYYLMIPAKEEISFPQEKTVLLVSSQPTVQDKLRDYVSFLRSQLNRDQWCVVIKPHPREDPDLYTSLLDPKFIMLSDQSVYALLAHADIHVSVYSTVLYEAIRYTRCNYVLYVEGFDSYYDEIVDSGVALPINETQLPSSDRKVSVDSHLFFADYTPSVLFTSR